ncbi:MAG: hypothetical protein UW07_C0055G0007 [Candidatus Nomurabacteria bacterium GW2011_GWF2_43_8]|uniref:Uncharacterized protein n=1 Tax=Candidatus Nomurabacteria bacterium GW2011_GWF2_43_8 TaxID=1618779 RepID=A0A0G1FHA8_9BACT|nr:MAG: hypothetical protein UW07_C0055G0007 [Candidatus Nomurabacteria bacterium GW2011_GWF2_43_8]
MEEHDKVFLEYVVKALVDNPNDVKIDRTVDEMGVLWVSISDAWAIPPKQSEPSCASLV